MTLSRGAADPELTSERDTFDMRLDAARRALDIEQQPQPRARERIAQWFNWPNWDNWPNWNNWGNWANWVNW